MQACSPGLLVVGALLLAACVTRVRVERWPLPEPNPTSWTFDVPADDARVLIRSEFSTRSRSLIGNEWRSEAPTDGGLLLEHELKSTWNYYLSPVYHGRGRPLPFFSDYVAHLSSPSPGKTTIDVVPHTYPYGHKGPYVLAGSQPHITHGGSIGIFESVEGTTVEEYAILRACGDALGAEALPEPRIPQEGIQALLKATESDDEDTRRKAIQVLGILRVRAAVPRLIQMLDAGVDERHARDALAEIGAPEAVAALTRNLKHNLGSADALGRMGLAAKDAVPALIAALRYAESKVAIVEALARVGTEDDRAIRALYRTLEDENGAIRMISAAGLLKAGRQNPRLLQVVDEDFSAYYCLLLGECHAHADALIPIFERKLREENYEDLRGNIEAALVRLRRGARR